MKRMVESEIADILNEKLQIDENGIDLKDNLHVDGKISGGEIVEDMSGYSATISEPTGYTIEPVYVGACKNGNKLTIVIALNITRTQDSLSGNAELAKITVPDDVFGKINPTPIGGHNVVDVKEQTFWQNPWTNKKTAVYMQIPGAEDLLRLTANDTLNTALTKDTTYYMRYEATILLNESLIPNA